MLKILRRDFIMLKQKKLPYVSHVLVCTNDRDGERKSCADNNSKLIKSNLKNAVNEKGWKGKVRISTSGCMGVCAKGSNVIIYPQNVWLSEVFPGDVGEIVSIIEHVMADE
jgi:(2Fe-2S) ferredoxin